MSWWRRSCGALPDRDLERELQDHLERRFGGARAAGLSGREAGGWPRSRWRRRAGQGSLRDVRGTRWAHDPAQDVHYGAPRPAEAPGARHAATLSLGLGIGANTAIFSLVDAVLLRALPVRDPEVARHGQDRPAGRTPSGNRSRPRRAALRRARVGRRRHGSTLSPAARPTLWTGCSSAAPSSRRSAYSRRSAELLTPADDQRGGGRRRADGRHQLPVLAAAL